MIAFEKKKPFKRLYMCECETCDQCTGGFGSPIVDVNNLYDMIKNPPPKTILDMSNVRPTYRPYERNREANLFMHDITELYRYQ